MTNLSKHLPTTEENSPATENDVPEGAPYLLGAFPKLVALPIPRSGDVVGRGWLDDAGVTDTKVSREHISFSRPGGRLHIEDLRSQNGTFVDGIKLAPNEPTQIDDGSIIRIGQTIFVYREAFIGPTKPAPPLGKLVSPWALGKIRRDLASRRYFDGLNVLLEGATGTGKELLAEAVTCAMSRPKMVPVNVAAMPRESFEGYMFGWEKNSFTGGGNDYNGLLRQATGGTVFLDEIEALPVDLQPKLLRFLEKREVQPLGARSLPPPVDCLLIGATNRSIQDLLTKDAFRRDIVARFQLRFSLPSLEDRPEDLFAILTARWEQRHGKLDLSVTRVDAEAIDRLMRHDWPENVRELFRFVDNLDHRAGIKKSTVDRLLGPESNVPRSGRSSVLTRETVDKAMADCAGNQTKAAKSLNVSRPQLLRWIKKNGKAGMLE